VQETDEAYLVEVTLPGVKRRDVEVDLAGSEPAVKGELRQKWWEQLFRSRTRRTGAFACRVTLPDEVNGGDVQATLAKAC
jgi:HSP20 family protein